MTQYHFTWIKNQRLWYIIIISRNVYHLARYVSSSSSLTFTQQLCI